MSYVLKSINYDQELFRSQSVITSGVSAGQIIPQWVLCNCLGRANLPSRPMGEFSLRKCDSVDANVSLFNTWNRMYIACHQVYHQNKTTEPYIATKKFTSPSLTSWYIKCCTTCNVFSKQQINNLKKMYQKSKYQYQNASFLLDKTAIHIFKK